MAGMLLPDGRWPARRALGLMLIPVAAGISMSVGPMASLVAASAAEAASGP